MDVPEPWLVEPVQAAADLDNLRLGDLNGPLEAQFELEALMLTGSCLASMADGKERVSVGSCAYFGLRRGNGDMYLRGLCGTCRLVCVLLRLPIAF